MSIFASTLKKLREENNMTRRRLAEKLNISETAVMRYETDYIPPGEEILNSLAEFFDVTPEYLLGYADMCRAAEPLSLDIAGCDGSWDGILREAESLGRVIIPKPGRGVPKRQFALKVGSNDMSAARIRRGDIVIFGEAERYQNGDIVAVRMPDGYVYIRRYYEADGIVSLFTESTFEQRTSVMYDMGDPKYRILGKALECRMLF